MYQVISYSWVKNETHGEKNNTMFRFLNEPEHTIWNIARICLDLP